MILDKKQIWAIFLFEFKMGHKAVKTTCNINNTFGTGTANVHTVQWWFKKQRRWEPWRWAEWPAMGSWQQPSESTTRADSLTATQEAAQKLSVHHSTVIQHLKQIGKVKKLDKWVPHELTTNQKNCHFEVLSSLILCNNDKPYFLIRLWCAMKGDFIWEPAMTKSVVGREEAPKHFPKPNLNQKKRSWSQVICCPSDPLQLSESWQNHYIWEVFSANWWDEGKLQGLQPALVNRKGPILLCDNAWLYIQNFALSTIFIWPLANWLPLFQASWQLFAGKMLPQLAVCRKHFPRVCLILKHRFLCYRNKQTYFSLGKMYWL